MIITADIDYVPDESVVLLPRDSRDVGNCNKGARAYFRRIGMDWERFVSEGIPVGEFAVFDERIRVIYETALERLGR
jgi:hypothetical protein